VTGGRLPRAFYARDTRVVARALIGKILVHHDGGVRRAARIVETEAYHGPDDQASHARAGPTPRAAIMFGPPGAAYVYVIYGRSHCMNVVTGPAGFPAAVLIRAAEPVEGCLHSTRGPGNLCRALGIRRERDNGRDLTGDGELYLLGGERTGRVLAGPRVNVGYAGRWAERPWRFALEGSPWVSHPRLRRTAGTRGSGKAGPSRRRLSPARRPVAAAAEGAARSAPARPRAARIRRGGSVP
jgi:DNA-3-methyladenine glycosylase